MGSIMKQWTPEKDGVGFEFSPILKPLEPFHDNVVVITGLHNSGEPGHSVSSATFLSGAVPHKGKVLLLLGECLLRRNDRSARCSAPTLSFRSRIIRATADYRHS